MAPEDLVQVLSSIPAREHPDLLVGPESFSDAGVMRIRPDQALVQTLDFFPPLVDDPRDYGRIAAANAISDCYAMGGQPLTVMNIVGFPSRRLDLGILREILAGGAEKVHEAGAVIVGGHSVEDSEVKFGLSVTGIVHPERIVSNAGAAVGDALVLTKPIGTGSVVAAIRRGRCDDVVIRTATESMATLNRDASFLMQSLGAVGATDITGFGLLGHAREMAAASGVAIRIDAGSVPLVPGSLELARRGLVSRAAERNRSSFRDAVTFEGAVDSALEALLLDAETSGGLMVSLKVEAAKRLVEELRARGHAGAAVIGEVVSSETGTVTVTAVQAGS